MSILIDEESGEIFEVTEAMDSQSFSFSGNSFCLKRQFFVEWEQRFSLCRKLLGKTKIVSKNTYTPRLQRFLPYPFKQYTSGDPGASSGGFLFPIGVENIKGKGPLGLSPHINQRIDYDDLYQQALITLNYDATTFVIRDLNVHDLINARYKTIPSPGSLLTTIGTTTPVLFDRNRYVTRITNPLTESLRLPSFTSKWVEGVYYASGIGSGNAEPQVAANPGTHIIQSSIDVTYVWHQVPVMTQDWEADSNWLFLDRPDVGGAPQASNQLIGAAYTHIGSVNSRWFDGFPPGTLLLIGVEARPYRWITGQRYYDYTYRMKFWNPVDSFIGTGTPFIYQDYDPTHMKQGTRPLNAKYSYNGHNYFLRYKSVTKAADGTSTTMDPFFALLTHNGKTLEDSADPGRPTFPYKDFEDLFIPYNRSHLLQFYQNARLTPLWSDEGT